MASLDVRKQPPSLPKTMKTLVYDRPRDFEVRQVPVPEVGENSVLVKIAACGVCGTVRTHDFGTQLSGNSTPSLTRFLFCS